ncbi:MULTISPECIES: hypothetical protein [Streptomyces]|uniref:Bulb-type lectin domain-containing protein n=1 Tax=Streptomyces olivaceiscleroticus TaxID=68245 RepID=A0ABN0ZNX4_9ACTN|nr:hypothetical protein [Streptomyces niger]
MANASFPAESRISRNMAWTSGNGSTLLRLQEDGNFCVYRNGKAAWQGEGAYPRGDYAVMQNDGNLVVYTSDQQPVWASETHGNPGAELVVQDDGNVVIYHEGKAIWHTNTAG